MTTAGVISGVSVSHVSASLDEIEAASASDVRSVVAALLDRDCVDEAFALQTCNRAEAYVVADTAADGRAALADVGDEVRDAARVELDHDGSLRHLMRVAAGLESLVLGEDQILGQFKTAMADSRAVGGVGAVFDDALTKAVHVGERARAETGINEGVVSLASAAVRLAEAEADLDGATALVVGTGEMGTLAARALDSTPVERLVVANRTVAHAERIADDVRTDASAAGLDADAVAAAVADADVVVTATGSPHPVLTTDHLREAGETVLVDIAQPRDVDPSAEAIDGVSVHDIDALESVTDETRQRREREAERVEAMIDDEFERLLDAFKRTQADDAIGAMYEGAERIKHRELDTALTKLEAQGDLTDEQRETIESLADALVGQLLAAPTESLREAAAEDDWTTIQTAMRLFDPEAEFGTGGARTDGAAPDGVPADADVPRHVVEQLSDD